jgi:MoaA/NifB/PqqE/SkfB family radical SAM enzyme
VTNRCNLRCTYCNCPFIDPTHLDLARITVLFDRLKVMGIRRLGLAGGEPMMRKDIGEIIAMAKARGFYVSVNSNLTLYDRHPEWLAAADLVYTSLDGDEAAHVAARGEGSHAGVMAAIAALVRAGKPVIAICVVTEHSLHQTDALLRQAETLGFRIHFQPQCTDTDIVRGAVPASVSNEEFRGFWRGLLAEKRRGRPIVSSTPYLEFLSRWEDFSVSAYYAPETRCAAGHGFLYIDPHGQAYPCAYTKKKTTPVDLLAHDWRSTWNRESPCTTCIVGPMLEFNLLFQRPLVAALDNARTYA